MKPRVGIDVQVAAVYMRCPYCGGDVAQDGSLMIVTNTYEHAPHCQSCNREIAIPRRYLLETEQS